MKKEKRITKQLEVLEKVLDYPHETKSNTIIEESFTGAFPENGSTPFFVIARSTSEEHQGTKSLNFSIETASLEFCKLLMVTGLHILIVFGDRPHELFAEWVNKIEIEKELSHSEMKRMFPNGDGTPTALIRKKSIPPLNEKLKTILSKTEKGFWRDFL